MDVLVVGGGPAGLAAGMALRQRGANVTVADARKPPIDKACGEGLMPDSLRELALLGVELEPSQGAEFRGIRFASYGVDAQLTEVATARFPASLQGQAGIGLRRQRLHPRMVECAEEAGVTLRWSTIVSFKEDGRVLMGGETARYGLLVGADGQDSQVRRWAGLDRGRVISKRFGFRQHFAVKPWSEFVEVHWGKRGQAYVTPVGENEVCVATMARDRRCRLQDVLEDLPWLQDKLRGMGAKTASVDAERGAVTTTRRLDAVIRGRMALVGDAAGSADAITGEGLAVSFRQARLLADCLGSAGIEPGLAKYARQHGEILRLPQTMARVMLLMDRSATFRTRAIHVLADRQTLFARMLGVHVGSEPLLKFVASRGWELAWRLAMAPAAAKEA